MTQYVVLSAILFSIGCVGVLTRRNAIVVFMCVELMLNAVNLTFIAFARLHGTEGHVIVFFVMTVAAAEAAVGLAIKVAASRDNQSRVLPHIQHHARPVEQRRARRGLARVGAGGVEDARGVDLGVGSSNRQKAADDDGS